MKNISKYNYEPVIGLEIHVQLKTRTKMFCYSKNDPDEKHPNINICPICFSHPGTLPVINEEAVRKVIMVGLALHGDITEFSQFDRKNYFYPDLPKGYQISQYQHPLVKGGYLEIPAAPPLPGRQIPNSKFPARLRLGEVQAGGQIPNKSQNPNPPDFLSENRGSSIGKANRDNIQTRRIRIQRVHLEEDTGRLIHDPKTKTTLVDFNRAGIPLMELVTEPDCHSAEEARLFAEQLKLILQYLDASDADMEKGQMRVEVNISLRQILNPKSEILNKSQIQNSNEQNLGTKVEIKNINSFKFAADAIEYEIKRQTAILERGEKVVQETRGWDEKGGKTVAQRSKEESHDYRYFPEPDLPPLRIEPTLVEELRTSLPELPQEKLRRFRDEFKIDSNLAAILVSNRKMAGFFEAAVSELQEWLKSTGREATDPTALRLAANYLTTDMAKLLAATGTPIQESLITPENFAELITYLAEEKISSRTAKIVLEEMFRSGADPSVVIDERKLWQVSEAGALDAAVEKIVAANAKAVGDYRTGKTAALQFLVGQIMKEVKGANPETVRKMLEARLNFPEKT